MRLPSGSWRSPTRPNSPLNNQPSQPQAWTAPPSPSESDAQSSCWSEESFAQQGFFVQRPNTPSPRPTFSRPTSPIQRPQSARPFQSVRLVHDVFIDTRSEADPDDMADGEHPLPGFFWKPMSRGCGVVMASRAEEMAYKAEMKERKAQARIQREIDAAERIRHHLDQRMAERLAAYQMAQQSFQRNMHTMHEADIVQESASLPPE